jgi:hypothetical protein
MSHAVESLVRHCFRGESGRQRDVALAIADGCPDHTGERMYKAIVTIAHLADVGHSTAERAIAHFVKVGWLIKVRPGGLGPRSTTEYRICPEWMRLAGEEIAAAYAERRLSRRVPIDPAERMAKDKQPKHPNLGCLDEGLSTPVEAPKHPNFEAKHPKNEPKHPSSWGTNYEHRTNTLNNNPLPPKGGEPEFERLKAAFPKKSVEDGLAAKRAWQAMLRDGMDAASEIEPMLQAIHTARQGGAWRGELGDVQFCPSLSKWLRGWHAGGGADAMRADESEPDWTQCRATVEREAKACGLGSFDEEAIRHSIKAGVGMQWPQYLALVRERKEAVAA